MPFAALPPALIWTIGIVGAAVLVRLVIKERGRVNAELERARATKRAAENGPRRTLRRDPRTGIYRP